MLPTPARDERRAVVVKSLAGFGLCVALAAIATALAQLVPIVGAPVFAIVIGVIVRVIFDVPAGWSSGIGFAGKNVLQLAIVLLGTSLSLAQIARVSAGSLPVMLGTLAVCLIAAGLLGQLLRIDRNLTVMLGVGTAICGASAIAAVSSVLAAGESEIAYAIAAIFLFNVIAVLTFPMLGHVLAFSQHAFGVWAGTAINDTSSVVAAGYVYGRQAGDDAAIVKLTRATLIIPIVAFLAIKQALAQRSAASHVPWRSIVPWFIIWFVLAALANSAGVIPARAHATLSELGLLCIAIALAGVGLSANIERMRRAGWRPLSFAAILWILVAVTSVLIQHLTGVT